MKKFFLFLILLTLGVGQMWGGTFTFSEHYNSNTTLDETAINIATGVTATFSKRSGGTATQYYTNGYAVRWYGGGTLVIDGGSNTITAITLSFGGTKGNAITANVGSYTDGSANGSGSWTGSASSVTFTQAGTSGHDRISAISVTTGSSCTDPSTLLSISSSNTATLGTDKTLTTSGGNGSSVTWTVANGTGSATVSGNTLHPTSVGTVTVTATQDDYNKKCGKVVNQTITISKAAANITLYDANGSSTPLGTFYGGDPYTPPTTAANCSGKVLVGWSTVEILNEGTKPSSNYADKGTAFTLSAGANNFYAVYATQGGSAPSASSLEFTYASHSGWTIGGTNEDKSTYYLLKAASGSKGYIESPTISDLSTITSVVVHAGFFGGADYGTFEVYGGSTQYGDTESPANKNDNEFTFNPSPNPLSGSGKIKIINAGSNSDANGTRLFSATINYSVGGYTYSNYATSCCTPLGSINGSFNCTSYTASARAFSWANETTASDVDHYELSYKEKTAEGDPTPIANNITNSTHAYTHEANLTEGKTYTYYLKAVGASGHCDATVEKDVLIPYATSTVTFNDNGKTSGSVPDAITQNTGTTVTVPGNTGNLAKDNYAFGGWNTKDDGTGTNYIADATFTLSNDITLYAKWDCAKKVTLTKGTPSNGSFSLSEADGDKYTCDGSVVVTVSDITPASGYRLVGITQTGLESGVSIDQANKTVTYAQYANGSSTINVEFEQIPVHTITWMVNGAEYTTGNPTTSVVDGNGITALPTTPTSCNTTTYGTFVGWYTTAAGSDSEPSNAVSGTKAVINHVPTGNETYYAVWANGVLEGDFVLVTDASTLNVGDVVTIANVAGNSEDGKVIKAYADGNNWPGTDVTTSATGKIATSTTDMQTFTLEAGTEDNTWAFYDGEGYIQANSSTKNYMKKEDSKSANSSFSLTINGQNVASLVAQGTNTHNIMRFNPNNGTPIFSCYETATQEDIYLYKQESGATKFISTCCTKHDITISDGITNGTVTSSLDKACEGTSVTLTATGTENAGRFKTWNVTGLTLTNEQKTMTPLVISMPDNDITVSATFDALYAITKVEEGGTITLGANYAAENDVVTISAVAKQDYEEPRVLKVYKTNDESTEITITNGQFTMPGYPVTAKVTYTPSKTPLPAPTMGANTNLSYNSVQINWTNVANNSGYALTVKQGDDIVEGYDAKAIDKDATSAVISGLEHLTAYTYTLYAKGDGVTYVAVNTAANGGFTTLDYPTVKIYYSENEVLRVAAGEDQKILTDFTLPSTALNGCTQKELVGWTTAANAEYSHETAAPAGMMLPGAKWQIPTNENCTLYAVYAKNNPETVSWSRVTAIPTLTDGGTFKYIFR